MSADEVQPLLHSLCPQLTIQEFWREKLNVSKSHTGGDGGLQCVRQWRVEGEGGYWP